MSSKENIWHISLSFLSNLCSVIRISLERWPKVNRIFSLDTFEKSIVEPQPRVVSPMNNNRTKPMLKNRVDAQSWTGRGRAKSSSKVARYPARTSFPAWSMMSEPSVVVVVPPTKRESERSRGSLLFFPMTRMGLHRGIASMHRERLIYANIRPAPRFQSTLASRMDNFNGISCWRVAIFLGDNGKSTIGIELSTEDDWKTDPSKCQVVSIVTLTCMKRWAKISLGRGSRKIPGAKKVDGSP